MEVEGHPHVGSTYVYLMKQKKLLVYSVAKNKMVKWLVYINEWYIYNEWYILITYLDEIKLF